MYFPNLLELSLRRVFAFPKAYEKTDKLSHLSSYWERDHQLGHSSSNKDLRHQLSPTTEFSGIKEIQTNVFS